MRKKNRCKKITESLIYLIIFRNFPEKRVLIIQALKLPVVIFAIQMKFRVMKKSFLFGFTFLFVVLHFAYSQSLKLKIIETSDVHGAIYPYNLITERPLNASLARVMSYVREQRSDAGQEVILLDNGDILQGTPVVYYYNFEKTDSTHLYAEVMNYMGYDAGSVGNHDIETGHDVYDRFGESLHFPWLAANATHAGSGDPYFRPYHIIKRGGATIAVLGLITPAIPKWLPKRLYAGIAFEDMIESASKWVKIIKERENPDLLIGLFHAGVDFTYGGENENTPENENASQLVAERVPGFDVVFVGHDHHGWNFTVRDSNGSEVLVLGTTAGARNVAVADILLQRGKSGKFETESIKGELVDMRNYPPDSAFMEKFAGNLEEVKRYVNRPIAEFTETISSRDAIFGPSKFVDLVHTIQLSLTGADISFSAPLSSNAKIEKGTVYVKDMFDLYSYENQLYTMTLSGREIRDYLEYSYANWFNQMRDETDHLLKFIYDDEGSIKYSERSRQPELEERYYNYESAAGIDYTVDVTKPAGQRVAISGFSNGKPFDLQATYRAAVNSYRGNGGGGHLTNGAGIPQEELTGRVINATDKDLRYYMVKWFEKDGTVTPVSLNNWKVIPENYWQAGMKRDYDLLFSR